MEDGLKRAIDFFRIAYGIPASRLLPYPALVIPFTYFFHCHPKNPTGNRAKYLEDYFWRVSLSGRYSQSVESRAMQDVQRIDDILENKACLRLGDRYLARIHQQNGYFAVGRAFVKALLCLLARRRPRSVDSNNPVILDNDWLKRANSKNYHHFFPKARLKKKGIDDCRVNHIANITLVDERLNKSVIKAKAPSKYIREIEAENEHLDRTLGTHLIGKPESFGIFDDDYELFFRKRCRRFSAELRKRILPSETDYLTTAAPASDTLDVSTMDENIAAEADA